MEGFGEDEDMEERGMMAGQEAIVLETADRSLRFQGGRL